MTTISEIVRVSDSIQAAGSSVAKFGEGLLITADDTQPAAGTGKAQVFTNLTDVGDVFAEDSPPYEAAAAWFGQNPQPARLTIVRWVPGAVQTQLTAGAAPDDPSSNKANNAAFVINGVTITVDLSSKATAAEHATLIQAALRTAGSSSAFLAGCTFAYDSTATRYVLTLAGADAISPPYFTTPASGTDYSTILGFAQSQEPAYRQGVVAEDIGDAVAAAQGVSSGVYFLMLDRSENLPATAVSSLSTFAEAGNFMHSAWAAGAGVLITGETTSDAATLSAEQYQRTMLTWSLDAEGYKHVSIAARMSGQNLDAGGQVATPKFKSLPGETSDTVTATGEAELRRKRINFYSPVGGVNIFQEGYTLNPGTWADVRIWIDWLIGKLETDIYAILRANPAIPQTQAGLAVIREAVVDALETGVSNGGIAPGTVSNSFTADIRRVTGDEDFDGELTNGYLIHVGLLADQSQADRTARIAPPIRVWLKGSGAFHFVDINLVFEA